MDFDQLVTFLEVAKLGSFSRAGQKVFRSQSAVSAQIRQLEQEYGDRLLDRSGKDVTLTPAGRVLFAYAERLLQMRDESLLAVADQGATPRGTVVVGANEATCLYVLPDVFAKYCNLHPGVQISIYRNFSYKIVEKLENGTIDVGIVTLPVKSASLKAFPIFRDQLMLMVSPQNPLAKDASLNVALCYKKAFKLDDAIREWQDPLVVRRHRDVRAFARLESLQLACRGAPDGPLVHLGDHAVCASSGGPGPKARRGARSPASAARAARPARLPTAP